jgi:hypothetical protein
VERSADTVRTWRFGVFEVDPRHAELRRGGTPVKNWLRVLWPPDTFVISTIA